LKVCSFINYHLTMILQTLMILIENLIKNVTRPDPLKSKIDIIPYTITNRESSFKIG